MDVNMGLGTVGIRNGRMDTGSIDCTDRRLSRSRTMEMNMDAL